MTAGQEIEAVVKTLSKGLKTGLAAKIKVTFSAVEQLIKVLEDKQCVKVLNISKREYTLEVSKFLKNIATVKNETVKVKNIYKYASKVLPSITGTLILSTPKGIMAHDEAFNNKQGGRIIVIAY